MMKKTFLILCFSACYVFVAAQIREYNRSSLATMMVFHGEDEFCKDIAVVFDTMPMPDKYNDHTIKGIRFVDFDAFYGLKSQNETYAFRSQDETQLQKNQKMRESLIESGDMLQSNYYDEVLKRYYCQKLGINYSPEVEWSQITQVLESKSASLREKINQNIPAKGLYKAKYGDALSASNVEANARALETVLNENQYAKYLVEKWFNLQGNSIEEAHFDMNLVAERGDYNATETDVAIALQSARGLALLQDAGEELIGNTYVIINDITYVTSEEKAAAAKIGTSLVLNIAGALLGQSMSSTQETIEAVNAIADDFTGFDVKTHSYLFRLDWNDEVAATFYNLHWNDVAAFVSDTSTYKLKYVAHAYEHDNKATMGKNAVNRNEYIKFVCTRSLDKNIAELQKKYEDFKVKTPVYEVVSENKSVYYSAKIGLKEGISEKSTFQVVKRVINPKTNRTSYQYVATIKPAKGKIWDNRYMMAGERPTSDLTATMFRKVSGGEILPGMLIIEGKYKKIVQEQE